MLAPMPTYEIELDESALPDAVVAALIGELDLTNARELEESLQSAAPATAVLAVDVNRVVFIDSAALHVLFKLARSRDRGRMAILMDPNAPISRTFDIVGMHDAIPVVASLSELEPSSTS
jgi:anti-anti-sigma factor